MLGGGGEFDTKGRGGDDINLRGLHHVLCSGDLQVLPGPCLDP